MLELAQNGGMRERHTLLQTSSARRMLDEGQLMPARSSLASLPTETCASMSSGNWSSMTTIFALRFAETPASPDRYLEASTLKLGYARKAGTAPNIIAPTKVVMAAMLCGIMMITR